MGTMQCARCKTANPDGQNFCGKCGAPLNPLWGFQDFVQQEIRNTLHEQYRDQNFVELEATHAVADKLTKWAKILAFVAGIPIGLFLLVIGFLGVRTYSDFSSFVDKSKTEVSSLVEGSTEKVRGTLKEAEQRAEEVRLGMEPLDREFKMLEERKKALKKGFEEQEVAFKKMENEVQELQENTQEMSGNLDASFNKAKEFIKKTIKGFEDEVNLVKKEVNSQYRTLQLLKEVVLPPVRYPNGIGFQEEYRELRLAESVSFSSANVTKEVADIIQPDIPNTLKLGIGTVTFISGELYAMGASAEVQGEKKGKGFLIYGVTATAKDNYDKEISVPLSKGSDVFVIVSDDGVLQTIRKRNLPRQLNPIKATVTPEIAVDLVKVISPDAPLEASGATLEFLVEPDTQIGRLTWTYTVRSTSVTNPLVHQYWVAATDEPRILRRENKIYNDHRGTITGKVWSTSPLKATEDRNLTHLKVLRTGGDGGSTMTGPMGDYYLPGTGSVNIASDLSLGSISKIENQAGAVMARNQNGTHSAPIDLDFNAAGDLELAQTSAFYWTNVAFNFHQSILTPLPTTPYKNLPTRVNINQQCNAFWNGSSINFSKEGTNCVNTAYRSVVLHEYGHGVDHWRGGILDGGYSEGYGDAVAILVSRSPCLGLDFLKDGTCLRDATDVVTWPPFNSEVHFVGKIYAGFTWELIQQLKGSGLSEDQAYKIASQLILAAAAGNPSDIPDAVRLSFLADDDDGNLGNGTPHCEVIKGAADSRTIPLPVGLNCAAGPGSGPGSGE